MKNFRAFAIFFAFLFSFLLLAPAAQVEAAEPLALQARSALLVEQDTGRVLYAQNSMLRVSPGGMSKLLTALVAIEAAESGSCGLDDTAAMTEEMYEGLENVPSDIGLELEEEISLKELLYCLLMESVPEAGNAIAIRVSGSVSSFVDRMNAYAEAMGCSGSRFLNANGLEADGQYTTAEDVYLIASAAFSNELIQRICTANTHKIPATNLHGARQLRSENPLLNWSPEESEAVVDCAKGTYSSDSGYSMAASAGNGEMRLFCVVLGADNVEQEDGSYKMGSVTETQKAFEWVFTNYSYRDLLTKGTVLKEIPVKMGDGAENVPVRPTSTIRVLMDNSVTESDVLYNVRIYAEERGEELMAPVTVGDVLGEVNVSCGGVNYGTVTLEAASSVSMQHSVFIKERMQVMMEQLWLKRLVRIAIWIVALYVLYLIIYNVVRAILKQRARAAARERISRLPANQPIPGAVEFRKQPKEKKPSGLAKILGFMKKKPQELPDAGQKPASQDTDETEENL